MRPRVLVADDEFIIRRALRKIIEEQGCDVTPVADGLQALQALARGSYQLVVTDLRMPEADGMQVVRAATECKPPVPVVVLTGHGAVPQAVEAMRLGAVNFLTKPFEVAEVESVVREALSLPSQRPGEALVRQKEQPASQLVGDSLPIARIRSLIEQVADSDVTVLITGESGTGKEVVARQIHERSGRGRGPFIAVNCAAIPEALLESELFGHVRGAFTGATQARHGRFTLAAGGTLFLDEIAEMSPGVQAKVLRVLQDKEVTPVGAGHGQRTDVRIVAATNKDLGQMIAAQRFREDLYYRLNVIEIRLPPLRDRLEDVPALCQHFLRRAEGQGRPVDFVRARFNQGALRRLQEYDWPGNVRELENFIERVLLLGKDDRLVEADGLPALSQGGEPPRPRADRLALPEEGVDLREEVDRYESNLIRKALERTHGNRAQAAQMLKMNRTTLVEKLKRIKD